MQVFSKNCVEVELIYNVVLISGVQQSESVIYIYMYPCFGGFFSHFSHYRVLSKVSYATQLALVVYFIYSSLHMSISASQFILPSYPLVIISLFSTYVILLFFCKQVHLYPFFLYFIYEWYCDICLFVSDLLYSVSNTRSSHIAANGIIFLFHGWIISHCIFVSHLLYPFPCW